MTWGRAYRWSACGVCRNSSQYSVVGLEPTELVPPPVVGLLGDAQLPTDIGDVLTLAEQLVRLRQLPYHLLRGVPLPRRHDQVPPPRTWASRLSFQWINQLGSCQPGYRDCACRHSPMVRTTRQVVEAPLFVHFWAGAPFASAGTSTDRGTRTCPWQGPAKALVAVEHAMIITAWNSAHRTWEFYREPGDDAHPHPPRPLKDENPRRQAPPRSCRPRYSPTDSPGRITTHTPDHRGPTHRGRRTTPPATVVSMASGVDP